jgi:Carboxypeptidase regulatory-like domain
MSTTIRRSIVTLLAALCIADAAQACSCAPLPPCESFWTADVVFIGRADSVVEKKPGAQVAQLAVDEWLRGERVGPKLTILSYGVGGSCDYGFTAGSRYLVHAKKRPDGTWSASLCGGTASLADAAAALKYIRSALEQPGAGTLSGNAFIDTDPGEGVKSGAPIANARLILRSPRGEQTARTDGDGNYRFMAVPAGEYTLVAELPDDHAPVPPKRLAIGKDACLRQVFWTTKR